jgi:hypothetical protein
VSGNDSGQGPRPRVVGGRSGACRWALSRFERAGGHNVLQRLTAV